MRWGTTIIMGWAFVFSQRREADRMPHPPIEPHSQIFPGAVPSMKSETRWGQEVMAISSGIGCARGAGAAVSSESGAVGTSIRQDGKTYGFPARQEHAIGTSIRCGPVCHRHDPRTVFGGFPGIAGTGSCVCHGPPGTPFVIISFSCRSKVSQSDAMAGKTNFSKCRRMGSPPPEEIHLLRSLPAVFGRSVRRIACLRMRPPEFFLAIYPKGQRSLFGQKKCWGGMPVYCASNSRFATEGRQRPVSQCPQLAVATPISPATSAIFLPFDSRHCLSWKPMRDDIRAFFNTAKAVDACRRLLLIAIQ